MVGILFPVTIFLSATLLFSVQPMFGKMLLPLAGGAPAVWNTALVFFQAALLAGYAWAHLLQSLATRLQAVLAVGLLAVAAITLPLGIPPGWTVPPTGMPVLPILGLLAVTVGPAFVAVSANAPLLQAWYARTGRPDAHDPYFLYAASNAGSLLGLLSYPLLVEPLLGLGEQSRLWTAGYLALAALVAACALAPRRDQPDDRVVRQVERPAGLADRLRWVALAAVPSSLLMGTTTHITTDIAAAPLLWVLPLGLYLLTFVLAFARSVRLPTMLILHLGTLCVVVAVVLWDIVISVYISLPLHLALFFFLALACHGALAELRPAAAHLTGFYLLVSIGGVLGGIFNALVAPVLFDRVLEYPLAIACACLLRPRRAKGPVSLDLVLGGIAVAFAVAVHLGGGLHAMARAHYGLGDALILATALMLLALSGRPRAFAAAVLALTMLPIIGAWEGRVLLAERSFFGVHRVVADPGSGVRALLHGTTNHGVQNPAEPRTPISYYAGEGPLAQALLSLRPDQRRRVAVTGLGAGGIACHRRDGEDWDFYEIDPVVVRIARDSGLFTYLRDCAPEAGIILGDARVMLGLAPAGRYGTIILDAFSSDSIPVHLLTEEAFGLYLTRLSERGVLLVHITNRHLDVSPVLRGVADRLGLVGRRQDFTPPPGTPEVLVASTSWVVLARREQDLNSLAYDPRWRDIRGSARTVTWTDDRTDLLRVLR